MAKQKQAEMSEQELEALKKAEEEQKAIFDHNVRFYEKGREVPSDAIKPIKAGRLRGMSDVNPMWRMRRMTEIFGPVGFGWKYVIEKQWTEQYGNEVKCFCNVLLFVRDPETMEWSEPIPGNGGSSIVTMEKSGPYVNDEGYKMALTDALSIAMKPLGIGGNVWYGPKASGHNESKYEQYTDESQQNRSQTNPSMESILKQAIAEISAVRTVDEFTNVWNKWACEYPTMCINGSEFWNAASYKRNQLSA